MKRTPSFLLAGLGEILWDLLPAGKQLGGATANFAYHAHALGAEGVVVSCVGADQPGREIRAKLRRIGQSTRYVSTDPVHPTGSVDVRLDAAGKPRYVIHEHVAWDHLRLRPPLVELVRRADALCFGSLCQRSATSRATIQRLIRAAPPGCLRVFDVNLRQTFYSAALLRRLLGMSDVLKLNDEELPVIARLVGFRGSERQVMTRLISRYGIRTIALTRGSHGSQLVTASCTSMHPGFRVTVADTVGAGDAFTAALVIGLLRGEDLDRINDYANRVASYVCSRSGATPPMPRRLRGDVFFGPRRPA